MQDWRTRGDRVEHCCRPLLEKVEKLRGDLMELGRDGELLEIEKPFEFEARLLFMTLRVGQVVDDAMVRILTGETHLN
jgi:hypothetical protein